MWSSHRRGSAPTDITSKTKTSRTFQEVLEQQAARAAGWGYDDIPLQPRPSVSAGVGRGYEDRDEVDALALPVEYGGREKSGVTRRHTIPEDEDDRGRKGDEKDGGNGGRVAYPQPSSTRYPQGKSGMVISSNSLPSTASFDHTSTSASVSGSSSYRTSGARASYHESTTDVSSTYPSSNTGTGDSVRTYPLSPTASSTFVNPWDTNEWRYPDAVPPVPPIKGKGVLKGWWKEKTKSNKARGKEVAVKSVEVEEEEDKPIFVGGGRGGAQNRRPAKPKTPNPPSKRKPSGLSAISETELQPFPQPGSSTSSTAPLVTFTPDVQEALETLQPAKPVFVGGGRGGMQNRKAKEVIRPSGASGSDASSSRKSSVVTGSSKGREGSARGSSVYSADSNPVGGSKKGAAVFVGGGRGGVQNRKPVTTETAIPRKKSMAGVDLVAGIGVSSYTVTTSQRPGSVMYVDDGTGIRRV